jgi:hypothetical protein
MTTTTTASVTFKTTVRYSLTTLTIVVPTEKRGVRTLTLNLIPMGDFSDLTATEQGLVYWVMGGKENTSYTLDITVEDLKTLKAIADRYSDKPAAVSVETAPVATSTPAPVKTGFSIKGSLTRPTATAAKVERTTEERIVRGVTGRTVGNGVNHIEERIDAMEKAIDSLADSELYMVMYDIQDDKDSVCPNPSWAGNQGPKGGRWFFWVEKCDFDVKVSILD